MINKPTIAQVVSYYPPHIGGMENVVQEISLKLAKNNWPVQVITSNLGTASKTVKEEKDNYHLTRLKSIEFAHTPVMKGLLKKLFSLPKKTVIHLHIAQVITPEAVWLVSKLKGIPYIAHFHLDVGPSGPLGLFFLIYKKTILGKVLRDANKVIATSKEQASLINQKYKVAKKKIVLMPNAVSDVFFRKEPRRVPKDYLRLLFVGRLCIQKRVDRLLDALAITKAPVELTIVGDGELRLSLENQVRRLGLNNVDFAGAKNGDELVKYYQQADVFVLPSDREAGMPLVLMEAMACGLPVIGSDVLGVSEFVSDCGILAKPTAKSFASSLDGLWQNKEQLSSLAVLSCAKVKGYSWDNLTKKLEKLYQEVLEESINADKN
ncbi:MAG: glycosyltransferase family 1 protein [Actinobacteria bacterium]|nr:MAG: glycosyltransferase family 1 protein [Actinomycetota bacterium]